MKGYRTSLAAKLWGIQFSVICLAIAACQRSPADFEQFDPATIKPLTTSVTTPMNTLKGRQLVRALAARAHLEKGGHAPRERILRTFDLNGNVTHEDLIVNGHFIARPSTLPTVLANRAVQSFVPAVAAIRHDSGGYDSTGTTVIGISGPYDDSLGSTMIGDTMSTTPATNSQVYEHSTDYAYDNGSGEIYYSSVAGTGDPAYSTGADVILATPEGAIEMTCVGNINTLANWGVPMFAKTGTAASDSVDGMTFRGPSETDLLADPCAAEKYVMIGAGAGFVVTGILALAGTVYTWGLGAGAAIPAIHGAGVVTISAAAAWAACRADHAHDP